MNKLDLLKKLLPGLLPLIVFVIADSIWGTEIGLYVAIGIGLLEVVVSLVRRQKPDKFVLLDIGLLVAMGGVSLVLENDIFFKLKPGVIGLLLCAFIGYSVYGKHNLMLGMTSRYMKGVEMSDSQLQELNNSLKILFWLFLVHTIAVFVSAFAFSKEVWLAVSGPGFYVIFGLYIAYEWYSKRNKAKEFRNEEWIPIVDEKGKVKGKIPRSVAHNGSKALHPVVHLHIINSKGDIYLQKRPANKKIQPGKWDTAVGGHISADEKIETALVRESQEEIGLHVRHPRLIMNYVWESDVEKELVFLFVEMTDDELHPHPEELDGGKYWSHSEIKKALRKEIFTPNFEHEYNILWNELFTKK
ncbi:NUDIX domain-containing protein [bacterium]|nr:NUDIX domain-containing protein [bacterium]